MKRRPFPRTPRAGSPRRTWRVLALTVAAIAALSVGVAVSSAAPSPAAAPVFSSNAHPFGTTLAKWSAAWWQFNLAIPAASPATDPSANHCRPSGVDDSVWFLLYNPGGDWKCDLPRGAALFLPVLNVDCSSVEASPFFGENPGKQRQCTREFMDDAEDIAASIDGGAVPNILSHRVRSPQFSFGPLPSPNWLGVADSPSGTAVSDGVYLMIKPLSAGTHEVVLHGEFPGIFVLDSTITVTVS
jgi:hypothetical protein